MNNNKMYITVLTSNKSGILAAIMMKGRKFGLLYQKNQTIKLDDISSRMDIIFDGSLNVSEPHFIKELESHPEIHIVENVSTEGVNNSSTNNSAEIATNPKTTSQQFSSPTSNIGSPKLRAHDIITPEAVMIVEESLTNILGPVAPMLVKSALTKTKHIGDLFFLLSKELEGSERDEFLSLVSDLNLEQQLS